MSFWISMLSPQTWRVYWLHSVCVPVFWPLLLLLLQLGRRPCGSWKSGNSRRNTSSSSSSWRTSTSCRDTSCWGDTRRSAGNKMHSCLFAVSLSHILVINGLLSHTVYVKEIISWILKLDTVGGCLMKWCNFVIFGTSGCDYFNRIRTCCYPRPGRDTFTVFILLLEIWVMENAYIFN